MQQFRYTFLIIGMVLSSCSDQWERTKPVRSTITESVYAAGKIKASDQYTVYPLVSGIVQHILVKAGDTVKAGTPLFRIDNHTASLNTENARLTLELSKQNSRRSFGRLQEAELNLTNAQEKYQQDSVLYVRQKRLWEQKIGTQLEYENRRLAHSSSRSIYRAAQANLDLLRTQLLNEQQRASVNYAISRRIQEDYVIRSTLNGKMYDVYPEKGDLVSPQSPLAVIGKNNRFVLELEIDENDIATVKVGQPVAITLSSRPGQVFNGQLQKIYPIMDIQSRTFKAEASITDPPAALYPNITAEANIIIHIKKNALIIPKSYLIDDKYVYVAKEKQRKVKTGLRDYRKVEITAGLDSTDFIYKPK